MLLKGNQSLDHSQTNTDGEVMIMAEKTNDRYNTILAALDIIDPKGAYVPGTLEHNWATEEILSWMAEMEPDEVLRKSETASQMFSRKRHIWQ
jgi:hypothetical protein